MNWAQFATIWKQLEEKIAFRRFMLNHDRKIAQTLKSADRAVDRMPPFRPDGREKRHEFSQHIGC
jgi:hypothetical protein